MKLPFWNRRERNSKNQFAPDPLWVNVLQWIAQNWAFFAGILLGFAIHELI